MRDQITKLFQDVGEHYVEKGLASLEIRQGHDMHAFYRLSQEPSKVIHVQGYPGLSSNEEARVAARIIDYDRMMEIRENEWASVGNEHEATIERFKNFEFGVMIP